ncbi:hypothetical protein EJB05_20756, partial [Eragrostis curvula]
MFPDYTAVTGLNPATDMQQGRGVLSPVFNLTIGIAAHNVVEEKCIKPGTTIRVSYSSLRLPLAAGRTPEMCVGAPPSSERRAAVARGHDVAIPGFLVDTLAEALRRGEAVFEVKLTSLARDDEYGAWDVVTCLVTAGMNSRTSKPCRLSSESSDSIPVPQQEPAVRIKITIISSNARLVAVYTVGPRSSTSIAAGDLDRQNPDEEPLLLRAKLVFHVSSGRVTSRSLSSTTSTRSTPA